MMDCTDLEAIAPELALGIADGAERAAALSHLAHCPRCQQLVEDLGRLADDLLLLGPEIEPPLGFETRVRDRIAATSARTGKRPRLRVLAAAAAIIVVAGLGGLEAGWMSAGGHAASVATGETRSAEGTCQVVAFRGHPSELVVRLEEPGDSGTYTVDALPAGGGGAVALGALHLRDGRAVLDATIPTGTGRVSAVRVIDGSGKLHYLVTFPAV